MNARVSFDTHAFIKRLEEAGMSVVQAEALSDALGEIVFTSLATKADISEARADIRELELRLKTELREGEIRLNGRLGAVVAGSTALTVAILGALITLA